MWAIPIAILVYLISPIVCVVVGRKLWGKGDLKLVTLTGIAAGPFVVALIQNLLLAVLPNQSPWVYPVLITSFFLLLLSWSLRILKELQTLTRKYLVNLWTSKRKLDPLALVVIGIVLFVFVRMVMYPPTWGDIYEYIEQGYVYSQDKALWRLNTVIPFTADSTYYIMNNAIGLGIPMIYSLFFLVASPTPYILTLTHFIYFYYFILLLITVSYGSKLLGLSGRARIWPVVLTLSSFYILRFAIYGSKEIMLMQLALLALYSLNELRKKTEVDWKYLILMSIPLGIGGFINLSGIIIAGIIGIIFMFWIRCEIKSRILAGGILASLIILFGGFQPWIGARSFIFAPSLLSRNSEIIAATNIRKSEYINYKLASSDPFGSSRYFGVNVDKTKLNVLLKGKLQAFTQPQYFGFIFYIWVVLMLIAWKKRDKFSDLEKLLLLYLLVYFFVIMDPLSLNTHQYAYVLAISPKYSLMLVPMIALMIVGRRKTILDLINRIPIQLSFFFSILGLLLIPAIRNHLSIWSYQLIANIMLTSQGKVYYLSLLNTLYVILGIGGITIALTAKYWQRHYGRLLMIGLFVFPVIFLLNSNFSIIRTIRYMMDPIPTKVISGEVDQSNQDLFTLANYINEKMQLDNQILFLFRDNKIGFFIKNRERMRMPIDDYLLPNLAEQLRIKPITEKYIIYTEVEKNDLILRNSNSVELIKIGPYIINKILNEK